MNGPRGVSHDTRALLLRRVEYGEADLVLHFFTEKCGRIAALARSARKSRKRFGGSLEPFHTLALRVDERGGELWALREARLQRPRTRLTTSLDAMDQAGRYLTWLRRAMPPRLVEPELFAVSERLLDQLDSRDGLAQARLASAGLTLIGELGWGLDLEACVVCGKRCEQGRAALLDPRRGGLVCRACGGGRLKLDGQLREELARVLREPNFELSEEAARLALDLVDRVLRVHAGLE